MSSNLIILPQNKTVLLGKSLSFDGSSYARVPYDARMSDLPNGDWTIEFFMKFLSPPEYTGLHVPFSIGTGQMGGYTPYLMFSIRNDGYLGVEEANAISIAWGVRHRPEAGFVAGKWYHVCLERYNNIITLYIDGLYDAAQAGNRAPFSAPHNTGQMALAGALSYSNQGYIGKWKGLLSNIRIAKSALYKGILGSDNKTAKISVPTSALEAVPTTSLLMANSDSLVDVSGFNWPITSDGTFVQVNEDSPFVI